MIEKIDQKILPRSVGKSIESYEKEFVIFNLMYRNFYYRRTLLTSGVIAERTNFDLETVNKYIRILQEDGYLTENCIPVKGERLDRALSNSFHCLRTR